MKTLITTLLIAASCSAIADTVINNAPLGSGTPGLNNAEIAYAMPDNMFFAPQYLPGYPTAAIIWPRVVQVSCEVKNGVRTCDSYNWAPKLGRGEYLFFVPVVKPAPPAPIVVTNTIERVTTVTVPAPVLPEAPEKKIGG